MLKKIVDKKWFHLLLFLITIVTTTIVGSDFTNFEGVKYMDTHAGEVVDSWGFYLSGLWYALPLVFILGSHEFGHYFMARYYKLKVSLPYFIPMYIPFVMNIGTMGAIIKMQKDNRWSNIHYFDVGIAGPLAGFVMSLVFIAIGFSTLPPANKVVEIHPEYEVLFQKYGSEYESHLGEVFEAKKIEEAAKRNIEPDKLEYPVMAIGTNLLFEGVRTFFDLDKSVYPSRFEMMHYPFLIAGFISLFFTALNLLPIGQLDGGHILAGMIGIKRFNQISPFMYIGFLLFCGVGMEYFSVAKTSSQEVFLACVIYGFILWTIFKRVFLDKKDALLAVVITLFGTMMLSSFLPHVQGANFYLFFMLLVGRLVGVRHPEVLHEEKIGTGRIVLGAISFVILVSCFSMNPFDIVVF